MVNRLGQILFLNCVAVAVLMGAANGGGSCGDLEVRAESFTVPPATGPLAHIQVRNGSEEACTVTVEPSFPDGWQWSPKQRQVSIGPDEVKRVPFAIEKATDVRSNRYPVEIAVASGPAKRVYQQEVVCASAPYYKPKIDGKFKDWGDAIPVTFITGEKKTVVSTYWNKRYFYLYVQVEEDKLSSYKKKAKPIDAVQFAVARGGAKTGSTPTAGAERYEFLIVDSAGMFAKDKCFGLIRPGVELSTTRQQRPLETIELQDAQVVVKRQGRITHYECAVPFSAMPTIKPDVGREISFSLLVHDPDGTGVRDWGRAAGLSPGRRNRFAWCAWGAVNWSSEPAYDGKLEWGLCSSKH